MSGKSKIPRPPPPSLRVRHVSRFWGQDIIEMTRNSFEEYFSCYNIENADLDLESKAISLAVSGFVVALSFYRGEEMVFASSGFIYESKETTNGHCSVIVTSAVPLWDSSGIAVVPDLMVRAHLCDFSCNGEIIAFDFHHNIALIKIITEEPQKVAKLQFIDDSLPDKFEPLDSNSFRLGSGDKVIAIGRHFMSKQLMAASGAFSKMSCGLHCEELCRATCKISVNGIGGPLVNVHGEVIGLNFFRENFTPFLPSNILSICLDHLKNDRIIPHPWLGVKAVNIIAAHVSILEKVSRQFNVRKGVLIAKVVSGSPADIAGIQPYDVIIFCGGRSVSCIELFQTLLEKADTELQVTVLRIVTGEFINLKLAVQGTNHDYCSWWPVPKKRRVSRIV